MAKRRSILGLIGATVAYWIGLALVTLGPAALAGFRATRSPEGSSSINANFADGRFTLNVIDQGVTMYAGTASALAIAAWVAIAPLIGWIAWAVTRKKSDRASSPVHHG